MEQNGLNAFGALDLAALLRVLDQNWYQISNKLSLTSEARPCPAAHVSLTPVFTG